MTPALLTPPAPVNGSMEVPREPRTVEDTGLTQSSLQQLLLKTLHACGDLTGADLGRRLGLPFSVIEPALAFLKDERQLEIAGGSMVGAASYRYRITDAGRIRATLFLDANQYVGVAPVPLAQYQQYMRAFAQTASRAATRDRVRAAFSHLVIGQRLLDQLGPAINAGHSMFVYGPPGNGKTVISQAVRGLLPGDIMIPHAIDVDGSIIRLFDPVNHEPVPVEAADEESLERGGTGVDRRWIRCRRPLVMVGGELTLSALELSYNRMTGFYHAPVQAVANGGVLVIDDFGRQQCPPRDLLNRWIVPLESRVDYLTLQSGQKFELPFDLMVIFATNLNPAELVDEAFLRRIHYKVYAESPTRSEYADIFEHCCREHHLAFDARHVDHLLHGVYRAGNIPLRGCQPRDLIAHVLALAEYTGAPRAITPDLLDAACAAYFVDEQTAAFSLPTPAERCLPKG